MTSNSTPKNGKERPAASKTTKPCPSCRCTQLFGALINNNHKGSWVPVTDLHTSASERLRATRSPPPRAAFRRCFRTGTVLYEPTIHRRRLPALHTTASTTNKLAPVLYESTNHRRRLPAPHTTATASTMNKRFIILSNAFHKYQKSKTPHCVTQITSTPDKKHVYEKQLFIIVLHHLYTSTEPHHETGGVCGWCHRPVPRRR